MQRAEGRGNQERFRGSGFRQPIRCRPRLRACTHDARPHARTRGVVGSRVRARTRDRTNCDETRSSGRHWWAPRYHASTTRVPVACRTSGWGLSVRTHAGRSAVCSGIFFPNSRFAMLTIAAPEARANPEPICAADEPICAICHEELSRRTRMVVSMPVVEVDGRQQCGHEYHWTCLSAWARRSRFRV